MTVMPSAEQASLVSGGLLVALLSLPVATSAHHSRVEYLYGAMHEVEGEVVRVVWRNPHIMLTVRAVAADGTAEDWILEGPGAAAVRREGLMDGHVSVGDHVRAAGNRSDRRDHWLRLANVLAPSGTELVFTSAGPRWSSNFIGAGQEEETEVAAAVPPEGIFRVWVFTGATPYVVNELPPLKSEAMAAYQAYDPLKDDPVLDCTLPGMPRVMTIAGSRPFEFERRGENIVIRSQNYNRTRVIHMGTGVDPAEVVTTPLGYSRGRWEGGTLVVATSRIDYPFFDLAPWWGIPQTKSIEIVERFTPDGDRLVYDFWAYDPTTFTAPIDKPRVIVWDWQPGLRVETDHCEPYFEEP